MRPLLALLFASVLVACPGEDPQPDAGTPDAGSLAPALTGLSPTSGPTSGGTVVLLTGDHFLDGATVRFGDTAATDVTVTSARRISARTPARPLAGTVDVTVENPDGQSVTLASGFVYEGDVQPHITEAVLLGDATLTDQSGADPVAVTVRAEVEIPTVTDAAGQGAGVQAQVGFVEDTGSASLDDITWTDASYDTDANGRDVYTGKVSVPGATGGQTRVYRLAVRFSWGGAQAGWVIADRDGAANGAQLSQLQRLEVSQNRIDWCRLGGQDPAPPPNVSLSAGEAGPLVFVQLYEPGVTDSAGAGANVEAQLGHGAYQSEPASGGWTWTDGAFNVDTGGGANDEWMGTLTNPGEGSYSWAWRVRVDGGPWRYCDADGSGAETGFELDQAGRLTVTPAAATVDRCRLQHPATLQTTEGAPSAPVYGWVWAAGITNGQGQGGGVNGDVGYGPVGADPSDAAWTWSPATFNEDKDGDAADEYTGTFVGPAAGTYAYAFRFRLGTGSYTYCDLDGSDVGGYSQAQAGVLTALPPQPTCRLAEVVQPGGTTPAASIPSGDPLQARARLHLPNVTSLPGAAPGVLAQVGVGTAGSDASTVPDWGWQDATYEGEATATGEDVWRADFHAAYTGSRAVAFRFSTDNGATWLYCDGDGSANGHQVAEQHALTVLKHADIDYCNLQFPFTTTVAPGVATETIYGQVFEAGLTPSADAAAADAAFSVELGFGPENQDPALAWTWAQAPFNVASGNNDEFMGTLTFPAAGTWSYAFRYRKLPAGGWCYGDIDGHGANTDPGLESFSGQNTSGQPNLGQATVAP